MKARRRRVVILGVGNILKGDDGVGVHIAHLLQEDPPQAPNTTVEIWDVGISHDLAWYVMGADKAVIIDAVRGGGMAGSLYCIRPDEISPEEGLLLSLHQRGIAPALREMAILTPGLSEVVIIGIEPKEISLGTELSAEVRAGIPQAIDVVRSHIRQISPAPELVRGS